MPSAPHMAMTVHMLREAGASVETRPRPVAGRARPARAAATWAIEPDLSNAAPFLGAALVTGGRVTVPGWPAATTQPGDALRGLLAAMGAQVPSTGRADRAPAPARIHGSTPTCTRSAS